MAKQIEYEEDKELRGLEDLEEFLRETDPNVPEEPEPAEEGEPEEVLPKKLRDESLKKKKRKRRRRRKANPFVVIFVLLLILFACYRFLMSDFFTLTHIEVSGNKYYTPAQVIEISGIETGWNLFKYDRSGAKAALLDDPYISLAEIRLDPPSTMLMNITEREEYACIPYGGQFILIDREGLVLRIADKEPVLPLLEGMTIIDMTPGKPLTTEETYLLSDTLELLSIVDDHDIYFKRVNFSSVVVRAYIKDQLYCEGTPANIRDNMAGIAKLAQELYQKGIDRGIIKVGKNNYLSFSPQIE